MSIIKTREVAAALEVVVLVGQIIRQHKQSMLGGIPSGELYSELMGRGIDLGGYNRIIEILVKNRLVEVKNHLITWIGPEGPEEGATNG